MPTTIAQDAEYIHVHLFSATNGEWDRDIYNERHPNMESANDAITRLYREHGSHVFHDRHTQMNRRTDSFITTIKSGSGWIEPDILLDVTSHFSS